MSNKTVKVNYDTQSYDTQSYDACDPRSYDITIPSSGNNKTVQVGYAMQSYDTRDPRSYDITIPSSGNDTEDLETVYRYMNLVDGDPRGVESQLIALKERSLSVGDTVTIDGKTYMCMMAGWKLL